MILNTIAYRSDGIFSQLLKDDQSSFCVTLEHAFQFVDTPPGLYEPVIPRGATYRCVRGMHHLESQAPGVLFETFEVTGITGHTGVIFHWGNWNKDSRACILVGEALTNSPSGEMITKSQTTFAKFMALMVGIETFSLIVQ